jgi:carbon storage regulator CsrA
MLVLTRKYQEKIRIGENITITVLRMKGKAVRLGIEAPSTVPVVRGELSFEVPEAKAADEDSESSTIEFELAKSSESRSSGRTFGRAAAATTPWTTKSRPDSADRGVPQAIDKVGFSRVPRDKVADLLPKLVSGTAPLRAMLDQRSTI